MTLLVLYAHNVVGATSAAVLANLSGVPPSYLLARYWIWSGADRRRPGRQVALYWIVSIISMLVSSAATGQISRNVPRQHLLHLAILGGSYFMITLVLWAGKYIVYERSVFKSGSPQYVEGGDSIATREFAEQSKTEVTPTALENKICKAPRSALNSVNSHKPCLHR